VLIIFDTYVKDIISPRYQTYQKSTTNKSRIYGANKDIPTLAGPRDYLKSPLISIE